MSTPLSISVVARKSLPAARIKFCFPEMADAKFRPLRKVMNPGASARNSGTWSQVRLRSAVNHVTPGGRSDSHCKLRIGLLLPVRRVLPACCRSNRHGSRQRGLLLTALLWLFLYVEYRVVFFAMLWYHDRLDVRRQPPSGSRCQPGSQLVPQRYVGNVVQIDLENKRLNRLVMSQP